MKYFAFKNQDTGDIFGEWHLNPSQGRFMESKKKFVLFSGGYGCQGGETMVWCADSGKEVRLDSITEPFYVLSHTGDKALALPPVKYKKAPLYRVKTDSHMMVCTLDHKVLTVTGWKAVRELKVGDALKVAAPVWGPHVRESFRSRAFSYALHLIQRLQDFVVCYLDGLRFYGAQPLLALESAPTPVPLLDDARLYFRPFLRTDAPEGLSLLHTSYHQDIDDLPSKMGFSPYPALRFPAADVVCLFSSKVFERVSGSDQSNLRFLLNKATYPYKALKVWCSVLYGSFGRMVSLSWSYPAVDERIESITYERYDHYYDLHVLGTNSYYAQGFFHHNCGKSLMLTLKAIEHALKYPGNYILMGRKTYPELRDTLIKEFFNICPEPLIENYLKAEGRVVFPNKSEIIFRHLDTIAESEIRSLNLGSAFIDQAEDVSKAVFDGLRGRLRRAGVPDEERKIYMSCNPALTWLFADFKQNPQPEYEVIEASTLENAKNLPPGYIEDLMKYPESYRRQFVEGVWDMSLLSENTVFAREHIEKLIGMAETPKSEYEGLKVYRDYIPGHRYQMGIDPSEGLDKPDSDWSVIVIVDLTTYEEVAQFSGKVPPGPLAEKAALFARKYADKRNRIMIVPEMNSIGSALVLKLQENQDDYYRIFRREEYDKISKQKLEKVGWRTTTATKPMLTTRFSELLRLAEPRIYTKETIEQFKSFVWTDEARKRGMGAQDGFHDDRVIATLLAFWERGPVSAGSVGRPATRESGIIIKNGKLFIPQLAVEKQNSWKTT